MGDVVDVESALFKQALAEEAAALGIDPAAEPHLLHIAEEALLAEPPPPWQEHVDPASGQPYYLNSATGASQWNNPAADGFRQRVVAERERHHRRQQQQQQQQSAAAVPPPVAPAAPAAPPVLPPAAPPPAVPPLQTPPQQARPSEQQLQLPPPEPDGPRPADAQEEDEDYVEYIVARRLDKRGSGELEYKVHWNGTDKSEDEWFLRAALISDYPDMLRAFDVHADAAVADGEGKQQQQQQQEQQQRPPNPSPQRKRNQSSHRDQDRDDRDRDRDRHRDRDRRRDHDRDRVTTSSSSSSSSSGATSPAARDAKALANLRREVERLEAAADTLRRELFDIREDRDALGRRVERLRKDCEMREAHTARLKAELATEADDSAKTRHSLRLLQTDMERLQRETARERREREESDRARTAQEADNETVTKAEADRAASEARERLARAEEAAAQGAQRLADREDALAMLREQANAMQEQLAQAKADGMRHTETRRRLEAELAEARAAAKSGDSGGPSTPPRAGSPPPPALPPQSPAERQSTAEAAEAALAAAVAGARAAEHEAAAHKKHADDLKKSVRKLKKTNAALKALLEESQREMSSRSQSLAEAESIIKEAKAREDEKEAQFRERLADCEREARSDADARIRRHEEAAQARAAREVAQIRSELEAVQARFRSEVATRRKLHEKVMELEGNIRVFCRARPVLDVDRRNVASGGRGAEDDAKVVVECLDAGGQPGEGTTDNPLKRIDLRFYDMMGCRDVDSSFEFDGAFKPGCAQESVYERVSPFVVSAVDGYDVCLFAYGQTGSGKTFTMEGGGSRDAAAGGGGGNDVRPDDGIYSRAMASMFSEAGERAAALGTMRYSFEISMTEIYLEEVFDLLAPSGAAAGRNSNNKKSRKVELRQKRGGGVYAEGLTRVPVETPEDVRRVMAVGAKARAVGSHDFNAHSSRSHLVMTVTIVARSTRGEDANKEGGGSAGSGRADPRRDQRPGVPPESSATQRVSRLHMIDLAGSERISKTAASGHRLKEAQSINKSLSALGNVICALGRADGAAKGHVPFRDSKLTHLLSESLSGSSKVIMMLCISPTQVCGPETLCSLKFAQRCRATKLGRARKKTMLRGAGGR